MIKLQKGEKKSYLFDEENVAACNLAVRLFLPEGINNEEHTRVCLC